MKKIFLILICLIFTSGLALAEHGTKKEKGYKAAGPKKTKGKNIYKSGFYSCVNGKAIVWDGKLIEKANGKPLRF